jgi:hypothetical protein
MNSIFDTDDLGDDPFPPTTTPAPKKRGRPAATPAAAKPKPKPAPKPKFNIPRFGKERVVEALMQVADELTPPTASYADKLRVAADLLEVIEKAKA